MQFEAHQKETVMLNPMKNMQKRVVPSEIRLDPLTGRTARICHFMKLSWPKPDFKQIVGGSEATCPFCPERIMKITPCFPRDIIPEGRLTSDDLVLFPNLAPYDSLSAVATLGSRHFVPIAEITAQWIAKGFGLAMDFFKQLHALKHPESVYHLINWNYMPASGSSLIHPHLQVFATSSLPNLMREETAAAQTYFNKHKSNYWDDLVTEESAADKRYLGKIGRTTWLSAFAPMGVAGDILAIVDRANVTLDLTADDLRDLATGVVCALKAYDRMGIYNFNLNFFPGAEQDAATRFHMLLSPRTFFNQALGTPDVGALRNLYNETLCMAFPEEINAMLKPEFE